MPPCSSVTPGARSSDEALGLFVSFHLDSFCGCALSSVSPLLLCPSLRLPGRPWSPPYQLGSGLPHLLREPRTEVAFLH